MRIIILFVVLSWSAFAFSASSASDAPDECAANFSVSGNFFAGKQYKTSATLPGVRAETAYKKAYASLVKKGYQITHADKDVGMISAAQQVSFSQGGKTAPLNILIEAVPRAGSKITFSFSTAGGLTASGDTVRDEFCKITSEVLAR